MKEGRRKGGRDEEGWEDQREEGREIVGEEKKENQRQKERICPH